MKDSILCIVTILAIALLVLQFSRNNKEPFVDLNIDLTVSDAVVNTGIDLCNQVVPKQTFLQKRNNGRCLNPRTPQEVRDREGCMPVDIPSRGIDGGFYQLGVLEKVRDNNGVINDTNLKELPLYQRRKDTDFSKFLYYTTDNYLNPFKIAIKYKGINCQGDDGCEELQHDDVVSIPELNASYRVKRCSDKLAKKTNKCVPKYYPNRYFSHNPPVIVGLDY